jgi:hypothetical protein
MRASGDFSTCTAAPAGLKAESDQRRGIAGGNLLHLGISPAHASWGFEKNPAFPATQGFADFLKKVVCHEWVDCFKLATCARARHLLP